MLLVSSLQSGKAWQARPQQTEKPFPHNLWNFMSSLCACPASSASTECGFSTYDLVWSTIRNSVDAEKVEKLVKIYWFFNLLKLIKLFFSFLQVFELFFFSSPSDYSSLFFKSFKFHCCSFCLIKKKLQIPALVCCLYVLVHSSGGSWLWFVGVLQLLPTKIL